MLGLMTRRVIVLPISANPLTPTHALYLWFRADNVFNMQTHSVPVFGKCKF